MSAVEPLDLNQPLPHEQARTRRSGDEKKAAAPFAYLLQETPVQAQKNGPRAQPTPEKHAAGKSVKGAPDVADKARLKATRRAFVQGKPFFEAKRANAPRNAGLFATRPTRTSKTAVRGEKPASSTPKATTARAETVRSQVAHQTGNETLLRLKADVKSILNTMKTAGQAKTAKEQPARQTRSTSQAPTSSAIDKMQPFRLSTEPAEMPAIHRSPKTTLDHLTERNDLRQKAIEVSFGSRPERAEPLLWEAAPRFSETLKPSRKPITGNPRPAGKKAATPEATRVLKPASSSARRSKGKSASNALLPYRDNRYQPAAASPERGPETQAPREGIALNGFSKGTSPQDAKKLDTDTGSLFGKSAEQAAILAKEGAKKTAPAARAQRTAAWMRVLSERTSFTNRTDPHWKVMEMKLDDGDGSVTIKVMRDDDGVSVSVGFTDASLRAHAESQSQQILDSLRAQYNQQVSFSFSHQQESAFDSSMWDSQNRNRIRHTASPAETPEPTPEAPSRAGHPDRHVWIG